MRFLVIFAIALVPFAASAQLTRCQCSYTDWVGDCEAKVEFRGKNFKVVSNTQQCSRVDWYIGDTPQVTIVTDGADIVDWLGQSKNPKTVIQSCKICKDSEFAANTPPISETTTQEFTPETFIGEWNSVSTCSWGSIEESFRILGTGNGRAEAKGSMGNCKIKSSRIDGEKIEMICSNWANRAHFKGLMLEKARMEGTYTQTGKTEVCTWYAIKQ